MKESQQANTGEKTIQETAAGTSAALWWLRHYEGIISFWKGFSWVWVIGVLLYSIEGCIDLRYALWLILCIGVIANTGIYLGIKTLSSHLKNLKEGPEKKEAYKLMLKIIRKRAFYGA